MSTKLIEQARILFGGKLTSKQMEMIPSEHYIALMKHPNKREMSAIYVACIQNDDLMVLPQAELLLHYCLNASSIEAAKILRRYYQCPQLLQMPNILDIASIIMQTESPVLCSYYNLFLRIDKEVLEQLIESGLLFPIMQLMSTIQSPEVLEYFFMTMLNPTVLSSPYVLRILALFPTFQTEENARSLLTYAVDLANSEMAYYIIQLFHQASEPSQIQELMNHIDTLISTKDMEELKRLDQEIQKSKKKVR